MSAIYDNWERLVAVVLKKEQLWQLFHAESVSPSISSASSGFSFSRLSSSLDDVPFSFSSPQWSSSNQTNDDLGTKFSVPTHSSIFVKDQSPVESLSPNKYVNFTPPRKRDLKIQVPKLGIEDRGFSPPPQSSQHFLNVSPKMASASPTLRSKVNRCNGKQESYPLPLPPAAISNSPHFSPPKPAVKSPSVPLPSPQTVKSPGTPWKKGKLIGRSPLGDVYLGFNSDKGQMCAMKEVSLSSKDAKSKLNTRMLEKEIALLSYACNHPNIVQYYGSEMVSDNFYIYYEYLSGGPINVILQQYGRLGESAIRSYTQQILSGLAYLHSKSIAHRDIKAANVLVDSNGRVKICNFGIEKHIAEQLRMSWVMDSSYWMAPEVIMNPNEHKSAVDIWSLGCTILEMATSKQPLCQYSRVAAMFKIANHKELPSFPDHLSDVCKDFLRHCLQWDPLRRATALQLLEHPFVKSSSPLGKQILVSTSSRHPAAKSEGTARARSPHQLDSGKVVSRSSRASKSSYQPSDIYTPRNISAPVSPVGSPLRQPQSMSRQETFLDLRKHSPTISTPSYWDPNILRGVFRFS